MASTVSELLVRIRPDGAEQTTEALEGQSQAFEDTAESAGEQLGMLEEFSQKWRGAMQTVVAGLAVAAAGIATQVPVLGELFSVISGFLTAIGLQIDRFIGPTLRPLISAFWDFNNAIASAEGPLGAIVGFLGTVALAISAVIAALAPFLGISGAVSAVISGLSSALSILAGVATAVVGAIAAILGVSAAVAAAIAIVIAAIIGFALAYITNFRGVRDRTNEFIGQIITFFRNLVTTLITKARELWDGVTTWVGRMFDSVTDTFTDMVNAAFRAGRSLVNELISGLRSRLGALRRMANRVASTVRNYLPGSPAKTGPLSDLNRVGPALVETVATGMERSTPRMERATGRVATAATPRARAAGAQGGIAGMDSGVMRQLQALVREMGNNRIETVVNLDSRELARGVEPLIARGAVNSGSTQVRR